MNNDLDRTQHPDPFRVLLVEDDSIVARGVARLLMARGLSVEIALSCGGARAMPGQFDLAIFDIELPDGLGVDLAHELSLKNKVSAVMFYTGATYQPLLRRAAALGPLVPKQSGARALLEAAQSRLYAPRPRFRSGILSELASDAAASSQSAFQHPECPTGS